MEHSLQKQYSALNINHLNTIVNHLEDMVFLIEVEDVENYRCVEVNPAYLEATGLPIEQLHNKKIEEIFSPEEASSIIENYLKAISMKKSWTYEECVNLGGEEKTFETTINPIFEENDRKCVYILGVSRDISERKKYEKALIGAKRELEAIIQHQQGLILKVEKISGEFYYTLTDGQLIDQLGITADVMTGKRPQDLFPEDIADNIIAHFKLCWETKEKVTFELSDKTMENELYWLTVLSPIIEKGQTTAIIAYAIDILDRKKSEESLMKTEKLALVGELAAGIGHELRNPLTAIRGFIKFIRENKDSVKDEFLDVIDAELESLNHIAGELMILAKPQAHHYKNVNMIELLDEALFLMEPEAFRQGVKFIKNFQSSFVPVYGEKYQLKQVIINLIKNAVDALSGVVNGQVIIECECTGGNAVVTISDNGCGIPKEVLEKLGEPFYTTKEKGTGLGLLVSYRIIKNHEGWIDCKSEEGKGTSFIIQLPICSK